MDKDFLKALNRDFKLGHSNKIGMVIMVMIADEVDGVIAVKFKEDDGLRSYFEYKSDKDSFSEITDNRVIKYSTKY